MKLNCELLVLSACETGYGKIQRGEGIMSLARAFEYAGVKSLLTSLWRADDHTTRQIMELFYENLKAGQSRVESLRNAKLKFLQTSDKIKSSPYYWANFILIGDATPLQFPNENISKSRFYFIALPLLALFIVYISSTLIPLKKR